MPIDATCPHCQKRYRLKDELVGKTVKCSTAECRRVFLVSSANGAGPAARPPAPPRPGDSAQARLDAERLAAQLFADDPDQKPAEEKQVEVTCQVCDFKWSEPASKVGKNVICPDCKHRQRIPEPTQKKLDWREATREGRKGPELPADLEAQRVTGVGIDALKQAGAIAEPEVEPRTLKEKLTLVGLAVGVLAAAGFGVWWLVTARSAGNEQQLMAAAVQEIDAIKDDGPLPKGQPPLLRAALRLAAGEYAVRQNDKPGLADALRHFGDARQQLAAAPRSLDRDVLYAELALAQLWLGGTDEQVKGETRLGWTQHGARFAPAGTTQVRFVQTELRQLFTAMQGSVEYEVRVLTARRLAREMAELGQLELLFEMARQLFADPEWPEARAQMLIAAVRAGAAGDAVTREAERLREQVTAGGPQAAAPLSAVALFRKLGLPELKPPQVPPPPQAGQPLPLGVRIAYATAHALTDQPDQALAVAAADGPGTDRIQGLAAAAEAAADPTAALDAAVDLVNREGKGFDRTKAVVLYRLVRVACDAGQPAKAEPIAKAIQDDGLREWATAEALRAKWAAAAAAVPLAEAPRPAAANLRVGHGWACLGLARHNAAASGAADAQPYDAWGSGELKGFGYAGLALGLQDRE